MDILMKLLFGTWTGILTSFVILFVIVMGIVLATLFVKKSHQPH